MQSTLKGKKLRSGLIFKKKKKKLKAYSNSC